MDSLSQAALGAAVAVAVMQRRTALWKAAAFGAVAGTLPDLDVFIDHGDPILNMVLHRAETHALFWLTLFSLPLGWAMAALARERHQWRPWWLASWAVLITHPLLDAFTVYGTQLFLPFSNEPVGLGSMFIIDPAYTLPLLLGVLAALAFAQRAAALKLNAAGLVLSTAYLGWSALAQAHVADVARESLAAQGLKADRLLVTPSPFNTVLWRVVAVDEAGSTYREGFYSLLDAPMPPAERIRFDRFERGNTLAAELAGDAGVQRIQAFSGGLWALREQGGRVRISDLRMGQEPTYIFAFEVATRHSAPVALAPTVHVGRRADPGRALPWIWRRLQGEPLPPPR
ncbi:MAG: metal-dependent hydrolase [Rubrivivax sp.]|nr:metal-dependent hydrolase [Rubrivivax sp.]